MLPILERPIFLVGSRAAALSMASSVFGDSYKNNIIVDNFIYNLKNTL